MFQHVLVPVDLSEKNGKALTLALALATQERSSVTVLHVIEVIENLPFEDLKSFYAQLEEKASAHLGKLSAPLLDRGVTVNQEIVYGKRVEEILKKVEESLIDLIVLSSHKIDPGQGPRNWGTLSHQVGVLAPCNILLVK